MERASLGRFHLGEQCRNQLGSPAIQAVSHRMSLHGPPVPDYPSHTRPLTVRAVVLEPGELLTGEPANPNPVDL